MYKSVSMNPVSRMLKKNTVISCLDFPYYNIAVGSNEIAPDLSCEDYDYKCFLTAS